MSAIGPKRTSLVALQMSAFAPKRTSRDVSPFRGPRLNRYYASAGLGADMKRRKFIGLIGGAVAMPLAVRAQQNERIRRLGVLNSFAKDAPESARVEAFVQELQRLGWTDGRNLQLEYRWETSDLQKAAMELVALSPDV